jgi:hypothetical protein
VHTPLLKLVIVFFAVNMSPNSNTGTTVAVGTDLVKKGLAEMFKVWLTVDPLCDIMPVF